MSFSDRVLGFGAFPNRDTTYEIDQSLMFDDGDTAYLHRTPSGAGDRDKWTFSCWVKRGGLSISAETALFGAYDDANNRDVLRFKSSDELELQVLSGGTSYNKKSDAKYRDPSAWYHIVAVYDSANATADYRIRLYVNGSEITSSTGTDPASGTDSTINNSDKHYIGARSSDGNPSLYWDGYMAEVHFIDGSALTPSAFGETHEDTGQWIPKKYSTASGAYDTNGFYLKFVSGALGTDSSGEGNNYTTVNLADADVMTDTPTNNFPVITPLFPNATTAPTLSQGNLRLTGTGSRYTTAVATMSVRTGAWYWEYYIGNEASGGVQLAGIVQGSTPALSTYPGWDTAGNLKGISYGSTYVFGATPAGASDGSNITGSLAQTTTGDTVGIASDIPNGTLKFYKNGTLIYTVTGIGTDLEWMPAVCCYYAASWGVLNFGQTGTFANAGVTAGGNSDANGVGDFKYSVPSGYLALCTANLPTPTITKGTDHFNTVLYTGNNSTNHDISGVGFQPDFTWIKNRSQADSHVLHDAVRGVGNVVYSDLDLAENNNAAYFGPFQTDGFRLSPTSVGHAYNASSENYAAWNWKANGSGSSNEDGSINTTATSANTTAGFSISTYTGTGESSNKTVGHGLGVAPSMIIVKKRGATGDWYVYHIGLGTNYNLLLNTNDEPFQPATTGWVSSPTSTTFQLSTGSSSNANVNSSTTYVAYCFTPIEGYSAFGNFKGNGSANGPFIYTGFRPAFIVHQKAEVGGGTANWAMNDDKRGYNGAIGHLTPNDTLVESTGDYIDIVSNGFKIRHSGYSNTNTYNYIYMAFAESPFKYSNAR